MLWYPVGFPVLDMEPIVDSGVRDRVLSSTEKNECSTSSDCVQPCTPDCVLANLDKSYESWNSLGLHAFTALSLGTCFFTVLTLNGFVSLLSCNSVFSILSLNSAFSILSTNSAFSIGCLDKSFHICF